MKNCTRIMDLNRYSTDVVREMSSRCEKAGILLVLPDAGGRYGVISGLMDQETDIDELLRGAAKASEGRFLRGNQALAGSHG